MHKSSWSRINQGSYEPTSMAQLRVHAMMAATLSDSSLRLSHYCQAVGRKRLFCIEKNVFFAAEAACLLAKPPYLLFCLTGPDTATGMSWKSCRDVQSQVLCTRPPTLVLWLENMATVNWDPSDSVLMLCIAQGDCDRMSHLCARGSVCRRRRPGFSSPVQ